jgi:threonine/homoserine/homoserine lactone efflux protein
MGQLLPDWPLFVAFLVASTALAVTPGPGVLYVVTRTLAQGRRCGLVSVAGVAVGNLGNAFGAAAGLAALLAVSSLAFSIVKYAGACYLVYLGVQMLRSAENERPASAAQPSAPQRRVFRDGFIVALFNPKTTLFYAAFLPQFVTAGTSAMLQTLLLASIFVAIAAMTDALYVLAAGMAARLVAAGGRLGPLGRRAAGASFIGLGLYTALVRAGPGR